MYTSKRTHTVVTQMRHNTSELAQFVAEGLDSKCLEPPEPLPSCWPCISKDISLRDVGSVRFVSASEVLGTNVWAAFPTDDDDGGFLFFRLAVP